MARTVIVDVDIKSTKANLNRINTLLSTGNIGVWMETDAEEILRRRTDMRFTAEGDSASGEWSALAESTVVERSKLGFPGSNPILVRTGKLKNAVIKSGSIIAAGPEGPVMRWPAENPLPGSRTEEAFRMAQLGSNKAPARPIVAADEVDMAALLMSLGNQIIGGMNA